LAHLQNKIHRVPIVDEDGKAIGIVTRTDLFWALVSFCNAPSWSVLLCMLRSELQNQLIGLQALFSHCVVQASQSDRAQWFSEHGIDL
jgi:signal-transduction protein with cAMP-binding, CBS, and nucleotidyltransferase domain